MKIVLKIFNLFSLREKKKIFILLFLNFISAFFDALGVVSIFPFISILVDPQLVEKSKYLNNLYELSKIYGISTIENFLFIFGVFFLIIFLVSIIFRLLSQYASIRFSFEFEDSISKRLIEGYLYKPYIWFLGQHSANLAKNILSETHNLVHQVIIPTLTIISQSLFGLFILVSVLLLNSIASLSVAIVLIACYICFFYFIKNNLRRIGFNHFEANQNRYTSTSEAFGAIKEIKFSGKEQVYIDRFRFHSKIFLKGQSLSAMMNLLPRYFIEAACFSGILFLILFLIRSGIVFINIIPTITLNLLIAYRLIPSLQQIYNSFSQIRFSIPTLNSICGEIGTLKIKPIKNIKNSIKLKDSISLKKIYFDYPDNSKTGLKNINITIPVFSKVGIIGASGSGKSTFVNIVLGLLNPSRGNLVIDGNIIDSNNQISWQSIIGYVPQQIYLSDSSIASNIAFGIDVNKIDYKAVVEVAKISKIHEFVIKKLPNGYLTKIGERGAKLSGGQIQRIGIARALYNKPQVLILDEATSGLDNLTEKFIFNSIDKLKKKITIIIVTHRFSALKNSDYIFWLKNGTLKMKGNYKKILESYEAENSIYE